MIYYKIIVSLPEHKPEEDGCQQENRTTARTIAQQIQLHTDEYNANNPDTSMFLSSLSENKCYIGAFSRKRITKVLVVSYLQMIDQDYTDIFFSETTFDAVFSMLRTAVRNRFMEDTDEFLEKLDLDELSEYKDMFNDYILTDIKSPKALIKTHKISYPHLSKRKSSVFL